MLAYGRVDHLDRPACERERGGAVAAFEPLAERARSACTVLSGLCLIGTATGLRLGGLNGERLAGTPIRIPAGVDLDGDMRAQRAGQRTSERARRARR